MASGCGSRGADEDSIVATATDVEKILGSPVHPVEAVLKMCRSQDLSSNLKQVGHPQSSPFFCAVGFLDDGEVPRLAQHWAPNLPIYSYRSMII